MTALLEVSVVLPVYNEGPRLFQTLSAIHDTVEFGYEIIVVNDASTNASCESLRAPRLGFDNVCVIDLAQRGGVAHARNVGAERARAPILIAMDAHCIPREGWLEQLLKEIDKPGVGIVAPQISSIESPAATTFGLTIRDRELGVDWLRQKSDRPYPVPLVGCACFAMRRELFEHIGRFDEMRSYGMEDVELCVRCWLAGYSVMMVPGAEVRHWFKQEPFAVNWHDYLYNRLRTAILHFDGEQLEAILQQLQGKPEFANAITSLLMSDIWERHRFVRQSRKHDAVWFCRKFDIAL